jgi:hypothetical protein
LRKPVLISNQMASRQIRQIVALTCENHNQFCVISLLAYLAVVLARAPGGIQSPADVRRLRSRCSSTMYKKAHIRRYDHPPDLQCHQLPPSSQRVIAFSDVAAVGGGCLSCDGH